MLLIAVIFTSGLELAGTGRTTWRCLVAAVGWTAVPCAAYAVTVSPDKLAHTESSLLVLRVFDQTGQAGQLLDGIQTRWRTIGPVWQIGGPDLAQMNVDLYETTLYLAGRLHEIGSRSQGSTDHS